jgi:3-methylfumaryl-CoA hydratase
MPPVRLPRRMFAGSEIHFLSPLRIEVQAYRISEILSVDRRKGNSGDLVLVRVGDTISQNDTPCIKEIRTIVYLGAGRGVEPVVPEPHFQAEADGEIWTPDSVALFRFSAVTFNPHRIHYDLPYATDTEGYPGLVVHGPFTALRLCEFAGRRRNALLRYFSFRGEAPLFCGQPIALSLDPAAEDCIVAARRCDGKIAMRATARV